jgi:hypothetical protein
MRRLFLLAVTGCLASGAAHAVPITDFVTVQPIDVCATDGSACAKMNNLGPSLDNVGTAAGSGVQVGFASDGINITNAIMNLAGINVVFQPTERYNNTFYQNLQVTASATNPGRFDSAQLQQLTQQNCRAGETGPCIAHGSAPTAPLNPSPYTLNMFFVKSLMPDPSTPGTILGLSWIGNNGIAIGANAFGNTSMIAPFQTVNADADVIAHEMAHNLGLDHANPDNNPQMPSNLMTTGNSRNFPNVNVPNFPSQTNASWRTQIVPGGPVDQLDPMTQIPQLLNPFGGPLNAFLNPIPNVNTMIKTSGSVPDFSVSFANAGREGESLTALTLTAPAGFQLDPSLFAQLPGGTPGIIVTLAEPNCTTSCTLIFGGNPFVFGDTIDYTIGVCTPSGGTCVPGSSSSLVGGTYTYQFSDGYETTSLLRSTTSSTILDATTWDADPAISPQIDPNIFVAAGAGRPPCVPIPPAITTCPDLVLADGDPTETAAAAVPEPPSLGIILAGLVFWLILDDRRRLGRWTIPSPAVSASRTPCA